MADHRDTRPSRPTQHRPRRVGSTLAVAALAVPIALAGVSAAASPQAPADSVGHGHPSPGAVGLVPTSVDDEAIRHRMIHEDAGTEPRTSAAAARVIEEEPARATDENDRLSGAEQVPRPQAWHDWQLRIDGTLSTETVDPVPIEPNQEDDGAIPLARDLQLGEERHGISTTGRIGDGPHGSAGGNTGDFDFYRLEAAAGDTLTVDITPDGELLPNALLYDAAGNLLIGAQDMTEGTGEAHLSYPVEEGGDYYVAVGQQFPNDPFDPASGPAAAGEGPYQLDVTLHTGRMADTDVYAVPLREGDVLGVSVTGSAGRIAIHELDGDLVQASAVDYSAHYPDSSPLPGGGNATANHVVERTGLYFVAVSDGSGDYSVTIGSHPAPSTTGEQAQTVLLDFSGPTFDNRGFGGAVMTPGIRTISPMRDFLPEWGLTASDERAVIEATTERVEEILREDIPGSRIHVTNSLESPDLWGKPGVSRVLVGGTVEESGLFPGFGVSESIDPGNFEREDTAIVIPELMTGDDNPVSLNAFLTQDSDRVRAVAQALGNTAGHEIGHFLGSYHTDDHDQHTNVMNTGNRLHMYAIGADRVAGTTDDDRIAMGTSRYDPLQGFSGIQSTDHRTSVALR